MELDHLFIRARPGAPEAGLLQAAGLSEGSGNRHRGQGTENRRFFLHNAFIELLWMADEVEAQGAPTRRTQLHERLAEGSQASPFGLCFRPSAADESAPFPMWDYTPAYLLPGMTIGIAEGAPLAEPMWFYLPAGMRPDAAPTASRQPLEHGAEVREITAVTVTVPGGAWSAAAAAASATGQVQLIVCDSHLLEVVFDHGTQGRSHDFRPALPLVFRN